MPRELHGFVTISKIDDEKRMVYGIANSDTLDCQDEIVEWDATKDAIPEFTKWRNLREMHKDNAVGTVPELEIDDVSKKLNIGAKVVDDSAWKKVKEGVYKGFSIGGKALERIKEFNVEAGKNISRVKKYVLNEISLVDRPANPDCVFTMIKRADKELPSESDPLSKDVMIMRKVVNDLNGKILTDDQIEKLGDNAFALIKKNGDVKERLYPIPDKPHAVALMKQIMHLKVTDGERHVIHENIKKSLGGKHSIYNCTYCQAFMSSLVHKGGDQVMDKQKLLQAQALIEELLAEAGGEGDEQEQMEHPAMQEAPPHTSEEEEYEGQDGSDVGPETENIVDAPQKDETEDVDNLQGSDYSDKEGGEDQEGFDDGTLDYSQGLEEDENRTHLYDTESERGDKAEMEGGDCPYCGSTVKALMSGRFRKGVATCPGCHTEYGVNAKPKVLITKRGGVPMRKSAGSSVDAQVVGVIGNIAKALQTMNSRLTKMESRPLPRKVPSLQKRGEGATEVDGDVSKAAEMPAALKADQDKALAISKAAQGEGRQLTSAERAFNESVGNRLLDWKVGKTVS